MNFKKFEILNHKLSIKKNDVVLFHINLASFKVFYEDINLQDLNYFTYFLLRCFFSPNGTFLIPSFSYKFCKDSKFDISKTKSEVGAFSNFLISKYSKNRSSNPIFSILAFGRKQDEFINSSSSTCFGKNSCFEKLSQNNGKIFFCGTTFDKLTFIHYLEEKYKVDYRKKKIFRGIVNNKKTTTSYFTRDLNSNRIFKFNRLKKDLLKTKKIKKINIGRFEFFSVSCKDIETEFKKKIKKNKYYYLK